MIDELCFGAFEWHCRFQFSAADICLQKCTMTLLLHSGQMADQQFNEPFIKLFFILCYYIEIRKNWPSEDTLDHKLYGNKEKQTAELIMGTDLAG